MNNCTVFISSSDSYADIWDLFFDLFKKYWPEYDGEIVLNTEKLDYSREDMNIRCTKVGKLGSFGKVFRTGLDTINTDNILLIMIDYIFMGKVNHQKIEDYFKFFINNSLDSLCLVHQRYPNVKNTKYPELLFVQPPAPNIMFSYQIAFWKKDILYQMALPHENPWMSEWFGSLRAEKMNIRLACLNKNSSKPISYDLRGCLHQGKWLDNAVDFLKEINYKKINYKNRGYYTNEYNTLKLRLKVKYMLWSTGLKGSFLDLRMRKKIH